MNAWDHEVAAQGDPANIPRTRQPEPIGVEDNRIVDVAPLRGKVVLGITLSSDEASDLLQALDAESTSARRWLRDSDRCGVVCGHLIQFVKDIAEDEWYSHGADRTDVQRAAADLLVELDIPPV